MVTTADFLCNGQRLIAVILDEANVQVERKILKRAESIRGWQEPGKIDSAMIQKQPLVNIV
jgi:hypothetical protein